MAKRRSSVKLKDLMPIILAIIGLAGTTVTAYFTFRGQVAPKQLEISTTQTAEHEPTNSATIAPTITQLSDVNTISISEVMANPCGNKPDGIDAYWNEYLKLTNYGMNPVDVGGLWISDGQDLRGNPDKIVSWETRYPGASSGINGLNLQTSSTIIPPFTAAIILSPQYLIGDVNNPGSLKPYMFPEGTVILTIATGNVLGSDDLVTEATQPHHPIVLYQGTETKIYKVISTYGSPEHVESPKNIKDDGKDLIPLTLDDCYAAKRTIPDAPDIELSWAAVQNGTLPQKLTTSVYWAPCSSIASVLPDNISPEENNAVTIIQHPDYDSWLSAPVLLEDDFSNGFDNPGNIIQAEITLGHYSLNYEDWIKINNKIDIHLKLISSTVKDHVNLLSVTGGCGVGDYKVFSPVFLDQKTSSASQTITSQSNDFFSLQPGEADVFLINLLCSAPGIYQASATLTVESSSGLEKKSVPGFGKIMCPKAYSLWLTEVNSSDPLTYRGEYYWNGNKYIARP